MNEDLQTAKPFIDDHNDTHANGANNARYCPIVQTLKSIRDGGKLGEHVAEQH